ncbi:excalibur calcium-binding domain-containing protein [Gordonia polyisoprenivorans]|uniref:Excalibur calcium-binding domain-containing protein n=1 Tax=Gordonia polyisoprenivorans TaxID=84595 RepID=A0A846WT19_9ACTN|nr:excalibur calcium-binding domain-containing protein [Gordonia polyisoprenivorans]OPX09578.1 excinuclease ABC subunit C [Gordonia sp. i37]
MAIGLGIITVLILMLFSCGVGSAMHGSDKAAAPATRTVVSTVTATMTETTTASAVASTTTPAPTTSEPTGGPTVARGLIPQTTTPTTDAPAAPTTDEGSSVYYSNCAQARAAGAAPLHVGDPGYRSGLDRDGDGVACES